MKGTALTMFCFALILLLLTEFSQQKQEAEKVLKRQSIPFVKSIQSMDGDIIDCVLLYNQPAFDHPLNKNHTIEMRPTLSPNEPPFAKKKKENSFRTKDSIFNRTKQLWHMNGSCPQGTIPIRRTTMEDTVRASPIKSLGMKRTKRGDPRERAEVYVTNGPFIGGFAILSIWKPKLQRRNEYSSSRILVMGDSLNYFEIGWHVHPTLYHGGREPRVYIFQSPTKGHPAGCYNLCGGFVQVSSKIALGAAFIPDSVYGDGKKQYNAIYSIYRASNGWWLACEDEYLGYWPTGVLTDFETAREIHWGGEVLNLWGHGQHTSTEMGSGHFPSEGWTKASFIRNIKVYNETSPLQEPSNIATFASKPRCYSVGVISTGNNWGTSFFYGGPGRSKYCP